MSWLVLRRDGFLQRTGKVSNPGWNSYLTCLFLLSKASVVATVCPSLQDDRQSEVTLPLECPLYQDLCTKVLWGREGRKEGEGLRVWVLLLASQNVQFAMAPRKAQRTIFCYWAEYKKWMPCLTLDTLLRTLHPPSDWLGIAGVSSNTTAATEEGFYTFLLSSLLH